MTKNQEFKILDNLMQRIYETVGIGDSRIEAHLNAIKFFCDPEEKSPAHITISGPQDFLPDFETNYFDKYSEDISIIGTGKFFDDNGFQNTVYLNCGFRNLREHWKKESYSFTPHITLYDGKNRDFASEIFKLLKNESIFFSVENGGFDFLTTTKGQYAFDLVFLLNMDLVATVTGLTKPYKIYEISPKDRLSHIKSLVRSLKSVID